MRFALPADGKCVVEEESIFVSCEECEQLADARPDATVELGLGISSDFLPSPVLDTSYFTESPDATA